LLPDNVAKTIASSIIGSRLDYCNALLAGTSQKNLNKLQRVQNNRNCLTRQIKLHHNCSEVVAQFAKQEAYTLQTVNSFIQYRFYRATSLST